MKVQLSLAERTVNRIFYESRPKGGLDRDVAVAKILNEAFAEAAAVATSDRVTRLNKALDLLLPMAREYAEGGGRHGIEMRTYLEARELAGRGE